jgi:hypothetical protein
MVTIVVQIFFLEGDSRQATSYYPTSTNPNAPYQACADFSLPFCVITLADFTQTVAHFIGDHKCTL